MAASAAAVTLAGLVGAGLGAAGSALVAARSIPAFDAAAGAYMESYPRERLERISAVLADDPVDIDPSVTAAYDPDTADELGGILEGSTGSGTPRARQRAMP